MDISSWATAYAAIVATGALVLEIRRWVESGPRLAILISPDMIVLSDGREEEKGLIIVTVMNRGDQPTTIATLGINEFQSNWHALFRKPSKSFVVPRPSFYAREVGSPAILEPGREWKGFIRTEDSNLPDVRSGRFWISLYTTDRDRYYVKEIPTRRKPPKGEEVIS
jgi:hypothetical protein